ncbi:MAG: alginate lyase family protein [Alphaproteobacteria bacterium]|jgi:hypothetical protein|nr:alginate lyase family protein [Alphaproteobacteria bacterium]
MNKLFSLILFLVFLGNTAIASDFISYNEATLKFNKEHISKNNEALVALIALADKALANPIDPVTNKTLLPASGNAHDYYSFGPYWWSNPDTADGLPYIRKDGETNPATRTSATDKDRQIKFSNDVMHLALAYYFTDDKKYANKAVAQLRAWFIDPKTKMNPHLKYAQAIPGIVDGRGIGILDTRLFINVMDSVILLKPVLSDSDYKAITKWYSELLTWMLNSPEGFEEDNWHNNHGTWFDAQVVAFALFTNQKDIANKRLQITQMRRIGGHFDIKGEQIAELERTLPWHYSNFNLEGYGLLGHYGEIAGVDIWGYDMDGHNLKNGFTLIAKTVINPKGWAYATKTEKFNPNEAYLAMLYASTAYEDPIFKQALTVLKKDSSNAKNINNLLF